MKKIITLVTLISFLSCKQNKVVVEQKPVVELNVANKTKELIKLENYINSIESYIHHINISTNDFDSISFQELTAFRKAKNFTKNTTEKNITYKNNSIVKVRIKDYLENSFIRVQSFYYDKDDLVGIRIYELTPSSTQNPRLYKRAIYYQNKELLSDSDQYSKNPISDLASFGYSKLIEEYQSSAYD